MVVLRTTKSNLCTCGCFVAFQHNVPGHYEPTDPNSYIDTQRGTHYVTTSTKYRDGGKECVRERDIHSSLEKEREKLTDTDPEKNTNLTYSTVNLLKSHSCSLIQIIIIIISNT